jgi:hypothetical protein
MENQGRGLLHVHGLTCYGGTQWTPSDVDAIAWASVPTDEEQDTFCRLHEGTDLRELVLRFQVHKYSANCLVDETDARGKKTGRQVCNKGFPMKLSPVTVIHDRDPPTLRRFTDEDGFVVPYNPHQICRGQCHVCI